MEQKMRSFAKAIAQAIDAEQVSDKRSLGLLKAELSNSIGLKALPADPDLLALLPDASSAVRKMLGIKPVRTLSGVAPIAIMAEPRFCPHGTCVFCPGGPNSPFGSVPQSYTGHEPASLRAKHNLYNPYWQTFSRLAQYVSTGHCVDKTELIVMGGTFPSYPLSYQHDFVGSAFKAFNDFGELFGSSSNFDWKKFFAFHDWKDVESKRAELHEKMSRLQGSADLKFEHARNERANVRCVAMCVETKPDFCKQEHVDQMLKLGTTRVELGVQSLHDSVLEATNRGHSVQDSVDATRNAKDAFLKVVYHMMPGLPQSSKEMDLFSLSRIFESPDFRPDGLKLYPCLVVQGTALYQQWKLGRFQPMSLEEAVELLAEAKSRFPPWVRVHRIERDIPSKNISAGIKHTNLRQYVHSFMKEKGLRCECIRCREAGLRNYSGEWKLFVEQYPASEGTEYFISAESPKRDALIGFCRLRLPSRQVRPEISQNSAGVRELHVFDSLQGLGKRNSSSLQHQGIGTVLLEKAEKIAMEELDARKLLVISGVGVREYYRKKGFESDGAYLSKRLR